MGGIADAVKGFPGGALISVEVMPGARESRVTGFNEWRCAMQIRVREEARKGRANTELLRFLSEVLGLPLGALEIKSGIRGRCKVVMVHGLNPVECSERLRRAHER
ncbi:MAG: DUF167 domain-containing protein [Candidatus Thermoplasmatota archaeon]